MSKEVQTVGLPYAWELESVESSQEHEVPTYQETAFERQIATLEERLKEKEEVIAFSRRRQTELEAAI